MTLQKRPSYTIDVCLSYEDANDLWNQLMDNPNPINIRIAENIDSELKHQGRENRKIMEANKEALKKQEKTKEQD
tara:strand:- start:164 stop:388 length:225 start_codon:yes stop_codon:yes gene_type:complete